MKAGGIFYIEYTSPADSHGKRSFTLYWEETDGIFRSPRTGYPLKPDGTPVGYLRDGGVMPTVKEIQTEIEKSITARPCGDCRACCGIGMTVAGTKTDDEVCKHLTTSGCGVYEERPQGCRDFYCLWRCGHGRLMERPDKVGYFLDVTAPEVGAAVLFEHVVAPRPIRREVHRGSFCPMVAWGRTHGAGVGVRLGARTTTRISLVLGSAM